MSLLTVNAADAIQKIALGNFALIDVRAQVEFNQGAIPGSINLPILNNDERAQVGTTYKQQGQPAAIELGHKLVGGVVKEARVQAWKLQALSKPTLITCFRGGLRSKTAQTWLYEAGVEIPRVEGGFKQLRQICLDQIQKFAGESDLYVLSGKTGAGKTELLKELKRKNKVDLEGLANHRGSSFGAYLTPQPSQISFENRLAFEILRMQDWTQSAVVIEDESRMIGRCVIPDKLFIKLRESPVIVLDEPLEVRVENTFQEYVVRAVDDPNIFQNLAAALDRIERRLGGLRYQELKSELLVCSKKYQEHRDLEANRSWIEKLLVWYYDPLYEHSWQTRKPQILFRGRKADLLLRLRT